MGLISRAISGDQAALARLTTLIENDQAAAISALDGLGAPTTPVHVLGITGPPGAGKSTLINLLLPELRRSGARIAVVLVDPSSQVSGGAVLGDRIRMLSWGDPDVFIRSQATRGQEGGLAPSTATLIDVFAHAGFDLVLIETVGVGQDGIDIRSVCDTTVVVQSPHQGDSVQSLKAGILEIANIFVVTKSDLPGAQQVVRDLNAMLHLLSEKSDAWSIPVVPVSAPESRGFDILAARIGDHWEWLARNSAGDRRGQRLQWEVSKRAIGRVMAAARSNQVWHADAGREERTRALLESALDSIRQGKSDF